MQLWSYDISVIPVYLVSWVVRFTLAPLSLERRD